MIHKSFFHLSKRFSRSSFVSHQLPFIHYFSTTNKPEGQNKPIFFKEKNGKTNKSTFITSEKIDAVSQEKEKSQPADENKNPASKTKSFAKSPAAGVRGIQSNKALEISRIQKLDELSVFLAKPQNIILSLHERNLIYDKLSKMLFRNITTKEECNYEKLIPLLDSFFSKLLVALQKSEDHKTYLALLNIPFPSFLATNFESFYRVCLSDLLTKFPKLKPQEFLNVLGNLAPLFVRVNPKSELCQQVEKILNMYEDSIDTLNIQNKLRILNLMRRSQVYNYKILDFMLYYTEMNFENLSYADLLKIIMTNIAAAKVVPYEILFRIRNRFNKQNDLRSSDIILTLAVFIRARLMFTEPLYENAFKRIQDPDFIRSLQPREIVMILNYYSKSKYRDQQLFASLFQELINNIQSINKIYMKILLLTLADMNYPDKETYAELYKTFNMLMKAEEKPFTETIPDLEEEEYIQVIPEYIGSGKPDVDPLFAKTSSDS